MAWERTLASKLGAAQASSWQAQYKRIHREMLKSAGPHAPAPPQAACCHNRPYSSPACARPSRA
jgi:hypothetical protein